MKINDSNRALTVSQINGYIKELLSCDMNLSGVWLRGEISNFKRHSSGHCYFALKDSASVIKCVMFSSRSGVLKFIPEDGMKVLAFGSVSVYERDGAYQFYVEKMEPDGVGALYLAYEQLKKKLEYEGLFDETHKRKLPFLPKAIGVITSKTGAVINDILHVTARRFPGMNVVLFPVNVQGAGASLEIEHALDLAGESGLCDLIIIARGGGSFEDLLPFNEERTARAIYRCAVPVISAVGHETDYSISDFVADFRAPTPSAAAEIAVPEVMLIRNMLGAYYEKIRSLPLNNIKIKRAQLETVISSSVMKRPFDGINDNRQYLSDRIERAHELTGRNIERYRNRFSLACSKVDGLSPLTILSRGYSVARKMNGHVIMSPADVVVGEHFTVTISDGEIKGVVTDEN